MPTIAIIGVGPRGLSALESLYLRLGSTTGQPTIFTLLFEATDYPGRGQVYIPNQPDTNWLNVPERNLAIAARSAISFKNFIIPSFPSYHEWSGFDKKKKDKNKADHFPTRSYLGKYFGERFKSIADVLEKAGLIKIKKAQIDKISVVNKGIEIITETGKLFYADEAVLTIGHQPTELSAQLQKWEKHTQKWSGIKLFTEPYPVDRYLKLVAKNKTDAIGLRGFGLAMIDVARALAEIGEGQFRVIDESKQSMEYLPGEKSPKRMVPFSLDGLPMAPKPLNAFIDNLYKPTAEQNKSFANSLKAATQNWEKQENHHFLINAIAPIISDIYLRLKKYTFYHDYSKKEVTKLIFNWLLNKDIQHRLFVPKDQSPEKSMQAFVDMATGKGPISLDYCIGQVWRHCQPAMYEKLSFTHFSDDVIADLIEMDERMKRYAYGPPVASVQQMLALIKSGIMTVQVVDDPDIKLIKNGWQFKQDGKSIDVKIMINTVLDSPMIKTVCSPIIRHLLKEELIDAVHDDLGVATTENGIVLSKNKNRKIPIAILGRLAKGTLIGVDAILECFGIRIDYWAKGVVHRHK